MSLLIDPVVQDRGRRSAAIRRLRDVGGRERTVGARVPRDEIAERIRQQLSKRDRYAGRKRDAERVLQPARVLDGRPALLPGHPDVNDPALASQPLSACTPHPSRITLR